MEEERESLGGVDFSTLDNTPSDDEDIQGEPLDYRACMKLCRPSFVREHLFRRSGRDKVTTPPKISDLRHSTVARVLLC